MEILTLPIPAALPATAATATDAASVADSQPGAGLPQGLFADLLALQLGLSPERPLAKGADVSAPDTDTPLDEQTLSAAADAAAKAELVVPALIAAAGEARPDATPPALPLPAAPASAAIPGLFKSLAATENRPAFPARPAVAAQGDPLPTDVEVPAGRDLPRQALAAVPATPAAFAAAAAGDSVSKALPMPLPDKATAGDSVPPSQTSASAPSLALPTPAAASASAAQISSAIQQPVTSPAWGGMLGERVVWMVGQQHQGVELHLNPAALGPLEIKLHISDGQANLTFSTQHAPVRDAIEAATPRLREMLGESGISLGSVSVNVGTFTQQQPGEQAQAQRQPQAWAEFSPAADFSSLLPSAVTVLGRPGMVDIFA